MQRPNRVTPTRMPSLGAIFRLLNTGWLRKKRDTGTRVNRSKLNQLLVGDPLASYLRASVEARKMPPKPAIIPTADNRELYAQASISRKRRKGPPWRRVTTRNQIGSRTCRNTGW